VTVELTLPALAHHSFSAQYDAGKPVEMKGAVTKVEWTNPHARVYRRDGGPGQIENWNFEMASPNVLARRRRDVIAKHVSGIDSRGEPRRQPRRRRYALGMSLSVAAPVAIRTARFAALVPLAASIPAMVMKHVAATTFPPTRKIPPAGVIGRNPVRVLVGRPRPVAVVPHVPWPLRIPVALDPRVARPGRRRHPVHTWRGRWLANTNVEGNLRVRYRNGRQKQS
jgi:uncharacterized protein DUF6152